jgi:4-amino-4-deoxy-L-arabinose transferase-like glycosyltransferase
MNAAHFIRGSSRDPVNPWLLDFVILLGLLLLAWFAFYVTPDFAASLPQDGVDYAVSAVNLLEHGKPFISAYGHYFPSTHPFGTSLLMLPAYALFGHNPGNGIYAILICALLTIALTYIIGVRLGGRLCGCFAALFLITHYGFWQYSQKIMSEAPSVLLGTVALALLLTDRELGPSNRKLIGAGAALGFAAMVRYDNLLFLLPAIIILPWDGAWRDRVRRVATLLAGVTPFLIILAIYQQATFGRAWWTSYHGLSDASHPVLSSEYIRREGFMRLRGVGEPFPGKFVLEGNGTFYLKSLLTEWDTTRIFGDPVYWQLPSRHIYQTLALARTALAVIGLVGCLAVRQTNLRNRFSQWLIASTILYIGFFLVFSWQEERFLLRLVPVFCVANGLGLAALFHRWSSRAARTAVVVLASVLVAAFAFYNWQMGFPSGNDLYVYGTLTAVAGQIESNAVVVSDFDPIRVDVYTIKGTDRIALPLSTDRGMYMRVGIEGTPVPMQPFFVSEHPERLREFIRAGKPVYWLITSPWSGKPSIELETLARSFRLQILATASVDGRPERPYFGRIYDLPPVSATNSAARTG